MKSGRSLAGILAKLLDRLVKCERLPGERQDAALARIAAAVRDLPREDLFRALPEAIGNNQRRRRVAVYLLAQLSDAEGAAHEIGHWFADPDAEWRAWLVQTIEEARLVQFAPALSAVIEHDPNPLVRKLAVRAAGELRSPANLPALLRLARACPPELLGYVLWALKEYGHQACRAVLSGVFRGPGRIETGGSPPAPEVVAAEENGLPSAWLSESEAERAIENRIVAAWGLGKLGDPEAIQYLGQVLEGTLCGVEPEVALGQSLRAAQALCDLFGWPFRWHRDWVEKTRTLWRSRPPHGS